jgi:hypothetical protein
MSTFPSSKKEQANDFLEQLYDRAEGDSRRLIITGWPARDFSGQILPDMRALRDMLLSDGLISESAHGAIGITDKGVAAVESLRASRLLKMQIDAPFPTAPNAIREQLEFWVRRQQDGEPGSIHWEQVQARIDHLRYLDQRAVEGQQMAKRNYGGMAPSLAPEKALKLLENQIAAAEKLRIERFGSALREEWKTTSESLLNAAFSPGNPIYDSFSAAQAIAFNAYDSDEKLRQIANDNLEQMLAVLRSAIEQLSWQLPESIEVFHPAGSQHDAYVQIRGIVRAAKTELTIVDTYVDETLWNLLSNVGPSLNLRVLTMKTKADFALEAKHFIAQHGGRVEVRITNDYHDRFLVVDRATVWHLGASIKDAGKKAFALTQFERPSICSSVVGDIEATWNAATTLPI